MVKRCAASEYVWNCFLILLQYTGLSKLKYVNSVYCMGGHLMTGNLNIQDHNFEFYWIIVHKQRYKFCRRCIMSLPTRIFPNSIVIQMWPRGNFYCRYCCHATGEMRHCDVDVSHIVTSSKYLKWRSRSLRDVTKVSITTRAIFSSLNHNGHLVSYICDETKNGFWLPLWHVLCYSD